MSINMKTCSEIREYRATVGWVPYEEYMAEIYHHCPGRKFDEWNMRDDFFDRQLEPNRLLREAAYMMGLKYRPLNEYTEEDQKELEEAMYIKFLTAEFELVETDIPRSSSPFPPDEELV